MNRKTDKMKVNDKHLSLLLMANWALLDDLFDYYLNGNFVLFVFFKSAMLHYRPKKRQIDKRWRGEVKTSQKYLPSAAAAAARGDLKANC